MRLVLPSKKGFEQIAVTQLPDGLEMPWIVKFDSYIIAPLNFEDISALLLKVQKKDEPDPLAQYFNAKWEKNNERLTSFIAQFSVANKAKTKDIQAWTKARRDNEQRLILRRYCVSIRRS
jgi:hypothetical protein